MKKCPYCAESIGSHSKTCKYCGEILPVKAATAPKRIKLTSSVIKAALFIILSKSLLTLFLYIGTDKTVLFGLLIDVFFSYHLFKMREWARKWIIGISIARMAYLTLLYLPKAQYISWIIDIALLSCIMVLLFGTAKKKKTITVVAVYAMLIICFLGYYSAGMLGWQRVKNIIKSSPLIMEQNSETGFKVILPSNNWRFIRKDDAIKLLGEFTKNANIVIANTTGTVYGFFIGEDLKNIDKSKLDMSLLMENFKKDLGKECQITNEIKADDGLLIESKYIENGTEYVFAHGYKLLEKTGVTFIFSGDWLAYSQLRKDLGEVVSKIQEISRKQFLSKILSQDMYKKYSDAVVLVRVYDDKGNIIGFSSGFNIFENGIILTNLHTIMSGYYMDIKFPHHGIYDEVYIAALNKKLHDLVILKIDGKALPYVNLDDSMDIEIGDKVVVISNPEGLVNSISEGIISGLRNIEGYAYYQMTAPISQGSSGGAVFNEFGNIIGIASGALEEGQNLNFCIPINEITDIEPFEQYITLAQFKEALKELKENKK